MYSSLLKQFVSAVFAVICIANVCSVNAQRPTDFLASKDKLKIVKSILVSRIIEDENGPSDNEVYFSDENLPLNFSASFPKIQGNKIILLSEKDLEERSKYGFSYYKFDEFESVGKSVLVKFSTNWENRSAGLSKSNGTTYKCQKRNKNWKCKVSGFSISRS